MADLIIVIVAVVAIALALIIFSCCCCCTCLSQTPRTTRTTSRMGDLPTGPTRAVHTFSANPITPRAEQPDWGGRRIIIVDTGAAARDMKEELALQRRLLESQKRAARARADRRSVDVELGEMSQAERDLIERVVQASLAEVPPARLRGGHDASLPGYDQQDVPPPYSPRI